MMDCMAKAIMLCLWATSFVLHCSVMAFSMKRTWNIARINDHSLSFPKKTRPEKKNISSGTILSMGGRNDGSSSNNNGDFDDFSSVDEIQAANDLAKEFYQQMKLREEQSLKTSTSSLSPDVETWEMKNGNSKGGKRNSTNDNSKKNRKFTGRLGDLDSTGTPSAGLFASQNGSVYAVPEKRPSFGSSSVSSNAGRNDRGVGERLSSPVRERMMRNEFNLVSLASNELTLIVQGTLVLVMLSFAIFIGVSGGITDGSDRFGAADGEINEYNGLGENIDLSKYMNDDSSITSMVETITKDDSSSSLWL